MNEYAKILDELIYKSGMSLTDVANKCKDFGINVTVSYLSKLRNGKMPPPSMKMSVSLAKALNFPPEKMIAAGLYDQSERSKEEIQEALDFAYPDMEYEEKWEKTMELAIHPKNVLYPEDVFYPDDDDVREFSETKYTGNEVLDLEQILHGKTLKWGDEVLNEDERKKAIEMMKILFNFNKGT